MVRLDFRGKVAFVTGVSAGMGAATARGFAVAGAAVAGVDTAKRQSALQLSSARGAPGPVRV
ncbi:hypothetical protein [Arthrobacter sp. NPDC093139]|uniref:hypothetical protein n=1 Tax=Arthrobacter sp. NPDC093139 TaxID=3363945 RepID=UPI003817A338